MTATSQVKHSGWAEKAAAALARLTDGLLMTVEGSRERYQVRRELQGLCERGEIERTLADSGIGPSDVYRLLRAHPRTRQQLAAMLRRSGVDRAGLPRTAPVLETLRAMEWRCGECADWRKCRAWLAASNSPDDYHAFCPNAEALDRLRSCKAAHGADHGST